MGNQDKLFEQIFQLKFTSKTLVRQAKKCEKEEKEEKIKVKKAIEKGNMDGAKMCAENAIRKRSEQLNYLRLSNRLDAVVSRLETQAKMNTITASMGGIVKALDSALASSNLVRMSETMGQFEKQMESMEVNSAHMETVMASGTALSTPEDQVNLLMQQVADEHGLEVQLGLPQAAQHSVPGKEEAEPTPEDDLSRRLAELRQRG